jgi:hypothetical protein
VEAALPEVNAFIDRVTIAVAESEPPVLRAVRGRIGV